VGNTGLKIFGEGEWLEKKHKIKRKLHLGLDLVSGQIVCSELTKDDIGDPTALPALLDQIDADVDLLLADGPYDGEPTIDLLTERFGSAIKVTIPLPKNAVLSPDAAQSPSTRDCHIADIAARGRMAWQKSPGYNQRSGGETLMGRWKTVIGPKLKARSFESQKTETQIGARILDRKYSDVSLFSGYPARCRLDRAAAPKITFFGSRPGFWGRFRPSLRPMSRRQVSGRAARRPASRAGSPRRARG
jgi:hypothetical protein